jgi:hypothetical protein
MPVKKQKEKIYFTIPWTRKHRIQVTKPFLWRAGLITLGLFIVFTIGVGSGTLQFAYGIARCKGLPVQSSDFMASYTYYLPGDDNYRPSLLSSYKYCNQEQAEAAGYRPSVVSEEAKQDALEMQMARDEAQRFSADKVDYQVFIPSVEGYSVDDLRLSEIKGNQHTFMRIKKEGTVIGQIRELRIDDSYNVCKESDDPDKDYCTVIGKDSQGREIKRAFHNGLKGWKSGYVGINIEGTGIILSSEDDAEALKILSTLQKY